MEQLSPLMADLIHDISVNDRVKELEAREKYLRNLIISAIMVADGQQDRNLWEERYDKDPYHVIVHCTGDWDSFQNHVLCKCGNFEKWKNITNYRGYWCDCCKRLRGCTHCNDYDKPCSCCNLDESIHCRKCVEDGTFFNQFTTIYNDIHDFNGDHTPLPLSHVKRMPCTFGASLEEFMEISMKRKLEEDAAFQIFFDNFIDKFNSGLYPESYVEGDTMNAFKTAMKQCWSPADSEISRNFLVKFMNSLKEYVLCEPDLIEYIKSLGN